MSKQVEILAYRRRSETVPLHSWLLIDKLTHFQAEAHITDGVPYVEIDFAYGGPTFCIKVYAAEASDVDYLVENSGTGEWDGAQSGDVVYQEDDNCLLMLWDLTPLARTFCELHFWNDEP